MLRASASTSQRFNQRFSRGLLRIGTGTLFHPADPPVAVLLDHSCKGLLQLIRLHMGSG